MGSVNDRSGALFFDFRYRGVRCREYSKLQDTAENRKKMKLVLQKLEAEIALGTFVYNKYFPDSEFGSRFQLVGQTSVAPLFSVISFQLLSSLEVAWRATHRRTQRKTLEKYLIPVFGTKPVNTITRANVLDFRAQLAQTKGKKHENTLTPSTINHIMSLLNILLAEVSERYGFPNPVTGIKCLKVPKSQVDPFNLTEVNQILNNVRKDFRNYYVVRFFTGMRPAEIDGLKWKFVDFDRKEILIRETSVMGRTEYTKNDGSQREIQMPGVVFDALKAQELATRHVSEYVFCTKDGTPIAHNNVTKRVWYPLLNYLGLKKRTPYQTRHTAATLWLASGENPEWIARQMGHTSTDMLFRVYSRYVPNLTRKDGSAFERLLNANVQVPVVSAAPVANAEEARAAA
ncbi:MAG: site-specific integrase [Pseudomonadota bacterium]